jgi:hypothetical protein
MATRAAQADRGSLAVGDELGDLVAEVGKRGAHPVAIGAKAIAPPLLVAERAAEAEVVCKYLVDCLVVPAIPDVAIEASYQVRDWRSAAQAVKSLRRRAPICGYGTRSKPLSAILVRWERQARVGLPLQRKPLEQLVSV